MYSNIKVEPSKMSTRGQIVIPQDIREKMGLKKNTLFMVSSLDKETIVMKKVDKAKLASEFLRLRKDLIGRTGSLSGSEIELKSNTPP